MDRVMDIGGDKLLMQLAQGRGTPVMQGNERAGAGVQPPANQAPQAPQGQAQAPQAQPPQQPAQDPVAMRAARYGPK